MPPYVLGQLAPESRHGAPVFFPERQSPPRAGCPTGPRSHRPGPGCSTIHAVTARIDAARHGSAPVPTRGGTGAGRRVVRGWVRGMGLGPARGGPARPAGRPGTPRGAPCQQRQGTRPDRRAPPLLRHRFGAGVHRHDRGPNRPARSSTAYRQSPRPATPTATTVRPVSGAPDPASARQARTAWWAVRHTSEARPRSNSTALVTVCPEPDRSTGQPTVRRRARITV